MKELYDVYLALRLKDGNLYYRYWQSNWESKWRAECWINLPEQKLRAGSYRIAHPNLNVDYEIIERN